MCFALFGIQVVWGLQNTSTSRIFQALGADVGALPVLWIAGPITGLIVQPIVGHLSDHSRSRFGKRRPFLLTGGLLTVLALLIMPNATTLWAAIAALWLLTASINIAMDPSRALVADNLPQAQHAKGYAIQVFFIGTGAVFASSLPWVLVNWFGVSGTGVEGALPPALRYAFYIGSACLLLSILWTAGFTRERPATGMAATERPPVSAAPGPIARLGRGGWTPTAVGAALLLPALLLGWQWEVVVLAVAAMLIGVAQLAAGKRRARGDRSLGLFQIGEDFVRMPVVLQRLAVVQFFTWFGLFTMWIYATPAIARTHFGAVDPASPEFNAAADWVGILFATYNGVAAIVALALPLVSARIGAQATYLLCLLCGAAGMTGFVLLPDPRLLWLAAAGVGVAWAAILSLPYAFIVNAVPPEKVGVYLGIHNVIIVIPQLVAAICLGPIMLHLLGGDASLALGIAAASLAGAALATMYVPVARQ